MEVFQANAVAQDTAAKIINATSTSADTQSAKELIDYSDSSAWLAAKQTLKDFQLNGTHRAKNVNDSLFIEFLKIFTFYQDSLNDLLYKDPNYETYNTLAYSSDAIIAPEAIEFKKKVKELGYMVSSNEGMIYLEKDPEFLSGFAPFISKRMNSFRKEYSENLRQPYALDASIFIPIEEHIRRMMFWEEFAKRYPDFELPEYAGRQFKMYLELLMMGTDNSMIYEWDTKKIKPELINAFNTVIENYPDSRASEYLTDYLNFLQTQDFVYSESVRNYGRKVFENNEELLK